MLEQENIVDIQKTIKRAICYLMMIRDCSPYEAQEWLYHEARARKACLDKVARAVLFGETVCYGYDVPI